MDPTAYKDVTTSRGLNYHYYFSPAQHLKPTLLFLHGFPSLSYDWRFQVSFFKEKGYGVIVPDMLGYGGTAKPTDPADYKASLIARDIVDILDAEAINKVISVAHDWGAKINSRFVNDYPQRVTALAYLAVGYSPPSPGFEYRPVMDALKKAFGYELFGYWLFFAEEGAEKIIESHWDSFLSILWPADSTVWKTDLAPEGALKSWLLADKQGPSPSYLIPEEKNIQIELLMKNGIIAPLNWYKVVVRGFSAEDDKLVPVDRYNIEQPMFFGGCKRDYVCLPMLGKANTSKYGKDVTYKEFDADHWVMLSHPDEVNEELLTWMEAKKSLIGYLSQL